MRISKAIFCAAIAMMASIAVFADEPFSIVDNINNNGKCVVNQPQGMDERLRSEQVVDTVSKSDLSKARRMAGYRIQVFSDNNYRTAKSEARRKEQEISERFPELRTYVIYNSPFWRLRVGDFRSQDDALEKTIQIKEAFPEYSREIRVVRDRIYYIPEE